MPLQRSAGPSRRDVLKGLAAAGIGIATGAGSYGYMYERHHIAVTRASLPASGFAPALAGLKIGFLTDIHRSATVSHDLIAHAVSLLLEERPDLIVLGGDYVTWGDRRFVEPAADALASLTAPLGIVAILGNHDDDHDMPLALGRRGFTVLRDARTRLTVRGESLDLAGIRYWTSKVEHLTKVLRGSGPSTILLAHTPMRLIEAASLAVPVVLSGHTHGGQIVLPGLGAVAARRFPVVAGMGRKDSTRIFVSRGVGTVYVPIRLRCPPEVAVLTLDPLYPG